MKNILLVLSLILIHNQVFSQMETTKINTSIGKIAVHIQTVKNTTPILLLHGVYYDYHLWNTQIDAINDRTIIAVDMPLHGESNENIQLNWTLEDCANMVIELLDSLNVTKVIAVGHSWGSMTILRAAAEYPERFQSIGLCNMPSEKPSDKQIRQFKFAHKFLIFRQFYTRQAAKSIIAKSSMNTNDSLFKYLKQSMNKLSKMDIKHTDYAVIINSDDGNKYIQQLKIPALALKGKSDYVPEITSIPTEIVSGGHSSPIEAPEAVSLFIQKLIDLYGE